MTLLINFLHSTAYDTDSQAWKNLYGEDSPKDQNYNWENQLIKDYLRKGGLNGEAYKILDRIAAEDTKIKFAPDKRQLTWDMLQAIRTKQLEALVPKEDRPHLDYTKPLDVWKNILIEAYREKASQYSGISILLKRFEQQDERIKQGVEGQDPIQVIFDVLQDERQIELDAALEKNGGGSKTMPGEELESQD